MGRSLYLENSMHCIPVLDLLAGVVVRAVRGDRAAYRPLVSPLVESSLPLAVAAAFYTRFGSRRFYVADLDAIQDQGSNAPMVHTLAAAYPDCEWWVDAGITSPEAFARYARDPNIRWVLGSESLPSFAAYAELAQRERRFILSLDSRAGQPLGPAELWTAPTLWPAEVIAMTLSRVGANEGPDFSLLEQLAQRSPHTALVAAGGTRHLADLLALKNMGVHHVLLASALHDGGITAEDLRAIAP
jgi:phosphoribosylformimino-5-aminoimidazole carboxamide ribotide isomerase